MRLLEAYTWINIRFLLEGLWVTVQVALVAISFSFILGIVLGVLRHIKVPIIHNVLTLTIDIIRNLPLMLHIFIAYFALPQIGIRLNVFWAAIAALTVFESAMISEIVRAGLKSVPKGQIEAGQSTGLNTVQIYGEIVLPQAIKTMLPALVSQFISLIKDSSLATMIALPDLTHHAKVIYSQNTQAVLPIYLAMAVLYFIICYGLSRFSKKLETAY
ncbi:ABC transporter permease subunit [Aerococcaceae bacterium DSM 109653]|uniref:ABC transporter permease subunit n=1 Tax=Fundicoccus ignavus TaxID=2664442 RepID=A0A844BW12_9LACT|nr:amino acid ABC transporter permease [Fundicoccus ignavus]MRI82332.1 ABC transporter permease subunit [Fundicoccus ignavus]